MPIKPVTRMEPPPVETPQDVAALVDLLVPADKDDDLSRGLGDHFSYLAATHPEWFAPYRELVLTERLRSFNGNFGDFCLLFGGAADHCVEYLLGELRDGWSIGPGWALASIGTHTAMTAAAVPLSQVVRDPEHGKVTWHYVSLRVDQVPGMPAWPVERIHVVGPRANWDWTLTARFDERGRYFAETVAIDRPPDPEDEEYFIGDERRGGPYGAADLRPYDADLVYCNGHIQLTPDVVGTAGGPPLGIYATPHCPSCDMLMFHVASVEHHVRDYGDGWRSVFVCEDCQLVTCNATGWN